MNVQSVPKTFRWQQSTWGLLALKGQWEVWPVCVGVQHLPVQSRLLALVLFPNTESKSTLRPREFCGCWGVGEAVNPGEAKRKLTIRIQILTPRELCSSQYNRRQVGKCDRYLVTYLQTTCYWQVFDNAIWANSSDLLEQLACAALPMLFYLKNNDIVAYWVYKEVRRCHVILPISPSPLCLSTPLQLQSWKISHNSYRYNSVNLIKWGIKFCH